MAVTTGNFIKPAEASVRDHYTRVMELCSYIQMLPSDINEQPLTINQKRNVFFNTFPKTWRAEYRSSAHDISEATILQVKTYMALKKLDMDKSYKKRKYKKDQKDKTKSGEKRRRSEGGRGRGGRRGRGAGPDSKCMKHPDGNHLWKDCRLNPRN